MNSFVARILRLTSVAPDGARQPFRRSTVSLGRCINTAQTTVPLLIEEASWYAEQQLKWTGVALAGELASEGLWAYQVRKQQEDRDHGRQP